MSFFFNSVAISFKVTIPAWLGLIMVVGIFNVMGLYAVWPYIFAIFALVHSSYLSFWMKPANAEEAAYVKKPSIRACNAIYIIASTILTFVLANGVVADAVMHHDIIDQAMSKLLIQFDVMIMCFPVFLLYPVLILLTRAGYAIEKKQKENAKKPWFIVIRIIAIILFVAMLVLDFMVISDWEGTQQKFQELISSFG